MSEFTVLHRCSECGWESVDWCANKQMAVQSVEGWHFCANCRAANLPSVFLKGRYSAEEMKAEIKRIFLKS